jgi:hypothetical protein
MESEKDTMNSQAQQLSPCPECGGARVLLGYGQGEMFLGYATGGTVRSYPFWAVCCTRCGHMTQYASQEFIAQAFEATRQQQIREQERLAKEAAREQKRQQR